MKREPSMAASALRATSLAITLVSIAAASTIAYSAFVDYDGVVGVFTHPAGSGPIQVKVVQQGAGATAYVNFSVPNRGLYPLHLAFLCVPHPEEGVSCTSSEMTVSPTQTRVFGFTVSVANVSVLQAGNNVQAGGNLSMALEPFASITVKVDFSSVLAQVAHR